FDADPSKRVAICGLDGKPRWHAIWQGNPIIATPADVMNGEDVHLVTSGPNCRPYIVPPVTVDTGWHFTQSFRCLDHVARRYLTDAGLARGTDAQNRFGPYVLIEPYTKHQNFAWPIERWNGLVAACPDLTFVQHVHNDSQLVTGAHHLSATFREA